MEVGEITALFIESGFDLDPHESFCKSIIFFSYKNISVHVFKEKPHSVYLYCKDTRQIYMGPFASDPKGAIEAIKAIIKLYGE